MSYERGLQEVGDGLYAYLQPDGGWGWSNAGLIVDGDSTLLVDTLFDLALTEEMLCEMRAAVPAAARVDTLVNTHANGDHCFGNQLMGDARIIASERTKEEMGELPAAAMASLVEQAPNMGALGEFFLDCFGAFDFRGIELAQSFTGFTDRPAYADARRIAGRLIAAYVDEEVDQVEIFYNRYISPLSQEVSRETLLPLQQATVLGEGDDESEEGQEGRQIEE